MDWEDEMSSIFKKPRAPSPVIVEPPTQLPKEEDLEAMAMKAAEVQALKARRRKKAGGTLLTRPGGMEGIAAVKKETLGA